MAKQTEDTLSERTMSDEESDSNKSVDEDADEWDSVSQDRDANEWDSVSGASETSTTDFSSSVWIYFDKNPAYAPGYNVCKTCSKKYSPSTSVTVLRNHLQGHQLKAPTRVEKKGKKCDNISKKDQGECDKYLVQWLIRNLQPFTVVDDLSFRAFVNYLRSTYVIPDRHRAKGEIDLFFFDDTK